MSPYRNKSTSSLIVGFVREDAKENEIEKVFFSSWSSLFGGFDGMGDILPEGIVGSTDFMGIIT
jgi:hypothetical protein